MYELDGEDLHLLIAWKEIDWQAFKKGFVGNESTKFIVLNEM